jgi:hypothetical protein
MTLEVRLKLSRGNLPILGLYDPEEGLEEDNDEFYKQLQDIYEKGRHILFKIALGYDIVWDVV